MLHFFLSYAHGERVDSARVHQFFEDLSSEIRVLSGEDDRVPVGFHDDGILRMGDDWPRELLDALCRAQTMIAFLSPRYFRSEFCGKEWAVFSERIRRWERFGGVGRARLVPIFWVRTRVPDVLEHVQYRDRRFGEAYEREGLRELMREKNGRDYERFVRTVALMVTEITGESLMPASDPRSEFQLDLRKIQSAFHPAPGPHRSEGVGAMRPTDEAPGLVQFYYGEPAVDTPPRPILSLDVVESPARSRRDDDSSPDTAGGPPGSSGGNHA